MKRWINDGTSFEYIEYETDEELERVELFEYDGEVLKLFMNETEEEISLIFSFVDSKSRKNKVFSENVILRYNKSDLYGIRKTRLTNFDPIEGLIRQDNSIISLSYKFKNPSFIGWNIKEEVKKEVDVFVYLGGMEKYEIILKKDILPKIEKKVLKKKPKECKRIYIDCKKILETCFYKIEYIMEFTNERKEEIIENSIVKNFKKFFMIKLYEDTDLKMKVNFKEKKEYYIKYEWERIWNFQYINKKYAFLEENFEEEVCFYKSRNSRFFEYSIYDFLSIREDIEKNNVSHKYIFDNSIVEIITDKNYNPKIYEIIKNNNKI